MRFRWGARPPDRVRSVIAVGTVVVSCALGLAVAASAHAVPGDEAAIRKAMAAYPEAELSWAKFAELTCSAVVDRMVADYARAGRGHPSASWKAPDVGHRMTVVSVGGVTVKGNTATAVGTSKIGKLKPVTQTVPLVREKGKWKVCPTPEAIGVSPQDHIDPPVTIPVNYVYDPDSARMQPGSPGGEGAYEARHDYCTWSPDYWPVLAITHRADFRGPCARHDMCYDANLNEPPDYAKSAGKVNCDSAFRDDLRSNCEAEFAGWLYWLQRRDCLGAAEGYYDFVTWRGGKDGQDPYPPI